MQTVGRRTSSICGAASGCALFRVLGGIIGPSTSRRKAGGPRTRPRISSRGDGLRSVRFPATLRVHELGDGLGFGRVNHAIRVRVNDGEELL